MRRLLAGAVPERDGSFTDCQPPTSSSAQTAWETPTARCARLGYPTCAHPTPPHAKAPHRAQKAAASEAIGGSGAPDACSGAHIAPNRRSSPRCPGFGGPIGHEIVSHGYRQKQSPRSISDNQRGDGLSHSHSKGPGNELPGAVSVS
jgi:hypothetical protein